MPHLTLLLAVALSSVALTAAEPSERRIPERCLELVAELPAGDAEAAWNTAYSRGFRVIQDGDYHAAETDMCQALVLARGFGPRDWRFAETLDELGLIAYQLGDFELAEQMQGAAIAEMLLAVGPHGEPFREEAPSEQSPIRSECRSGLQAYTTRLGWIHEKLGGRVDVSELNDAPWRIFAAGYLPLDDELARRLDWLVSRYLLEENLTAAEELAELQRRITGRP